MTEFTGVDLIVRAAHDFADLRDAFAKVLDLAPETVAVLPSFDEYPPDRDLVVIAFVIVGDYAQHLSVNPGRGVQFESLERFLEQLVHRSRNRINAPMVLVGDDLRRPRAPSFSEAAC